MSTISLKKGEVSFDENPAAIKLTTEVGKLQLTGLTFESMFVDVAANGDCSLGGSTSFAVSLHGIQGDIGSIAEISLSLGKLNVDAALSGTIGMTLGLDKAEMSFATTKAIFLDQTIALPPFSVSVAMEDLDNLWATVKTKIETEPTLISCFATAMVNLIDGGLVAWHKYWAIGAVLTPAAGCDLSFKIKENIPLSIPSFKVPLGSADFDSDVTGTLNLNGTGMDCSFSVNALGTDHHYTYHHDLQTDLVLSKLPKAVTSEIEANATNVIHSALNTFGDYTSLVDKDDIATGHLPKQLSHRLKLPTWPVAVPDIGLNLGNISLEGTFSGTFDLLQQQLQRNLGAAQDKAKSAEKMVHEPPPPPPHEPSDPVLPRHPNDPLPPGMRPGMEEPLPPERRPMDPPSPPPRIQSIEERENFGGANRDWGDERREWEIRIKQAEAELTQAMRTIESIERQLNEGQCVVLSGSVKIPGGDLHLQTNIKVPTTTLLSDIGTFIQKSIPPKDKLLTALELAKDIANKAIPLTNGVVDFSIDKLEWAMDELVVASNVVGPFGITLSEISLSASNYKGTLSNNGGHLAVGGTFEVLGVSNTLPSFNLPDDMVLNHGILEAVKSKIVAIINSAWLLTDNRFLKLMQQGMVSFNHVVCDPISFNVQSEYDLSGIDSHLGKAKLPSTSFSGSIHLSGNNSDGTFKALLKGSIAGPPAMNPGISFNWKPNADLVAEVNSWISSDLNRFSNLWNNIGNFLHAILDKKLDIGDGDKRSELGGRFGFAGWAVDIIMKGLSNGDAITDPKPPPPPPPPDPPDPPHPPKPHRPSHHHHHGW